MMRFFKSVGAASLCAIGLGLALIIIFQIQPVSPAGWVVLMLLALAAFVTALVAYRWMMGAEFYPNDAERGYGDRYMAGLGFGKGQSGRRGEDDADIS